MILILAALLVLLVVIALVNAPVAVIILAGIIWLLSYKRDSSPSQTKFYRSCTAHSTISACNCIATGENCECLERAFEMDPEWVAYKEAVCRNLPASPNRLLNSYSVERCPFPGNECSSPQCIDSLTAIEQKIRGQIDCVTPATDLVVPGKVYNLAGPLGFDGLKGFGYTGLALVLSLIIFRLLTRRVV